MFLNSYMGLTISQYIIFYHNTHAILPYLLLDTLPYYIILSIISLSSYKITQLL